MTLSVDWYRIDLHNAINTLAAQTMINQCYDDPGGISNPCCAAVFRNSNGTFAGQSNVQHSGGLVNFNPTGPGFLQAALNYSRQLTSGIDVDLNYNTKISEDWRIGGRAIVSWLATRNDYTSITEPTRITQEKLIPGNPEWNARLNLTWGSKGIQGYAGVDNVFNQLPPFGLLGTGTGTAIYATTGRFFYAGAQVKF